jgi:hypothetical protein
VFIGGRAAALNWHRTCTSNRRPLVIDLLKSGMNCLGEKEEVFKQFDKKVEVALKSCSEERQNK